MAEAKEAAAMVGEKGVEAAEVVMVEVGMAVAVRAAAEKAVAVRAAAETESPHGQRC